MKISKCILVALMAIGAAPGVYAQDQAPVDSTQDVTELSLEDLMNVKIVSASRKEEKAFDAPLSSYVITRKEIFNAGITSLPEALRLCPGLFVKQMYNGMYDVSIRGMDNVPTHEARNTNRTILVMINNRPVFDYLNGGTFWQDMPVDIIDVDRIEVVLGPSAPLYGPNAVTGVINIITVNPDKDGVSATAHVQAGSPQTYIGQAMVAYQVNSKFSVTGSVNYQSRGRQKAEIMDPGTGAFITDFSQASNPEWRDPKFKDTYFPDFNKGLEKVATNVRLNYKPKEDINIHLDGGFNNNHGLFGYSTTEPVSYMSTDAKYAVIKGDVKGFSFLTSVLGGNQQISHLKYKFVNTDAYLDYTFKVTDKFTIRPAVNYQHAMSSDKDYSSQGFLPIFQGSNTIENLGLSLKADYTLGKFRFIGAVRGDKFKYPSDWYFSYQGIVNFKPSEKHIFRAVVARSNGGSFMDNTYLNVIYPIPAVPPNPFSTELHLVGNKNRNLVENNLYELGYRGQLTDKIQLDLSLFNQISNGYSTRIIQAPVVDMANSKVIVTQSVQNLDVIVVQDGATLGLNMALMNNKINFKPFATFQKTRLLHYSPYYETPDGATDKNYSTETQQNVDSKGTPNVYGGFYANYAINSKWNVNLNGYYMSKYAIYSISSASGTARPYKEFDASNISGKFILNAKVAYQLTKNFNVFVNARNALNANTREFFATDKIGGMYLGGVTFTY